jgi:hypothetical protein
MDKQSEELKEHDLFKSGKKKANLIDIIDWINLSVKLSKK